MSILAALAASTFKEVRVGIITWRVKRITPRDMMEHGLPGIMVLREIVDPAAIAAARAEEMAADEPPPSLGRPADLSEDPAQKLHRQLLQTTTAQKNKAERASKHFEGLVCASVTHVRIDGQFEEGSEYKDGDVGGWVPSRVVPNEQQQDAAQGRLWVGSMPPGTVDKLYPVVMTLSAPKEVQDSLRRFLAEPEPASDDSAGV